MHFRPTFHPCKSSLPNCGTLHPTPVAKQRTKIESRYPLTGPNHQVLKHFRQLERVLRVRPQCSRPRRGTRVTVSCSSGLTGRQRSEVQDTSTWLDTDKMEDLNQKLCTLNMKLTSTPLPLRLASSSLNLSCERSESDSINLTPPATPPDAWSPGSLCCYSVCCALALETTSTIYQIVGL